jgi:hypothetical protein
MRETGSDSLKIEAGGKAITAFSHAFSLDDFSPLAVYYLEGLASLSLEKHHFYRFYMITTRAARLDKYHFESNLRLYEMHKEMDNHRDMLLFLHRLLIVDPDNGTLIQELASLYNILGQTGRSRLLLERAQSRGIDLNMNPDDLPLIKTKTSWSPRNRCIIP